MTGEELYTIYRRNLSHQGCETDEWADLDWMDQTAWNATAIECALVLSDQIE